MKPVIIYQMGKVGSTSVQESLVNVGYRKDVDCFHVHDLVNPTMDRERSLLTKMPMAADLITLTRDVVARNISCFFQCMDMPERAGQWYVGGREIIEGMTIPQLTEAFFRCPQWKHDEPLDWFDNQLKRVFGIDVYGTPFEVAQGWGIYQQGDRRCLLMRAENLGGCEGVLNNYLGISSWGECVNQGKDHWYGDTYRQFLKQITFPSGYLDRMYGSKYMSHFYSKGEIRRFRSRWGKKAPSML